MMVQSLWTLLWPAGTISKLRLASDVPKLSSPVNIIVYDSLFQHCDRHRQLPGYLSFTVYRLTNNRQLTKHQASEYLCNLLEYNSSRDPHLKFQNGGNGTQQLRQGFSKKTPITDTPFKVKLLK